MKLSLRQLLAIAFTVVATVPVLFLGSWVERTAMEKELAAVSEKHLLLARNITAALDRYALDAKAAFGFFAVAAGDGEPSAATIELARRIGFRHFSVIGPDGRVLFRLNVTGEVGDRLPAESLEKLGPYFNAAGTTFSDVIADPQGRPTIYLIRRLAPDRIALAALGLEYIRKLQKAIAFGRKGHSAIVDKSGNLIAHPNPEWQRRMKNIAKVKPVARMMAGETGVTEFYSPAVKKDMITGFTTVPSTGWGVMVQQPLEELEERAGDVQRVALFLIGAGLLTAALISWMLSGLLVRPIEAVVAAARDIAGGNLEARIRQQPGFAPEEFRELGNAFNAMARDIATVMIQRERVEGELREAHDELETRVEERTQALTGEIAERERAEESSLRLAAAIEGLSENFALYGPDDRMIVCNKGYRETNEAIAEATAPGTSFEDHLRAMVEKGLAPEAAGREEEWLRERLERHRNPGPPFEVTRQDGRWFLVHEQRMADGATATIATDITERKRAEEALSMSEERLRGAVESFKEGFALFDAEDRLVMLNDEYRRVNPAAQAIMERGGTFEDVIRANVARGALVEATGREEEFIRERLELHRDPKGPLIRPFTDGSWYMLDEVKTPEGGTALSFINITEIKEAEQALRQSERRFKDFAEVASDWFWEMDEDLRFSFFSGRNFEVTGFDPEGLIGKTRREVTKEDTGDERWRRHFADMEARRPFHDFCYQLTTPDGGVLHISISGTPVFDDDGAFRGYRGTGTDISARVLAEEALRDNEEKFRAVVDNLPSAIFLKDKDGRYLLVNRRYEEWYQTTNEEMFGKTSHDRFSKTLAKRHAKEDARVLETGEVIQNELRSRFPDGTRRTTLVSKFPIMGLDGSPIAIGGVETDITDRKNAEEALREAKEVAEFASRAKTEFLANMSHELRTPLNSVIGFSDVLMSGSMGTVENPKFMEYMLDINASGKHLLELINDILDVARIERGYLTLNEKKLDVPLLMNSCRRLVHDRAFEAGIDLKTDVSKSLPALFADELRTKQILLNLLSNAIKFTPKGGTVDLRAAIDGNGRFELSVADTGIGISPEDIETALTDFGQVDGALTRRHDGAGLGLPLSKKLTELHGGELIIESKLGSGTKVRVLFPKTRTIHLS